MTAVVSATKCTAELDKAIQYMGSNVAECVAANVKVAITMPQH